MSVIPALGDDYLIIKKKDARNRKFPWSLRPIRSSRFKWNPALLGEKPMSRQAPLRVRKLSGEGNSRQAEGPLRLCPKKSPKLRAISEACSASISGTATSARSYPFRAEKNRNSEPSGTWKRIQREHLQAAGKYTSPSRFQRLQANWNHNLGPHRSRAGEGRKRALRTPESVDGSGCVSWASSW